MDHWWSMRELHVVTDHAFRNIGNQIMYSILLIYIEYVPLWLRNHNVQYDLETLMINVSVVIYLEVNKLETGS